MKLNFLAILLFVSASVYADVAGTAENERNKVPPNTIARKAENGWLYSKNELQHLAKGELANGKITAVSACRKAANANPVPALAAFHTDLQKLGIKLFVVPVPPKMAVYPFGGLKTGDAMSYLKLFYEELRTAGIHVIDLSDIFIRNAGKNVYCKTDAHWAPNGIELAAGILAEQISQKGTSDFPVQKKDIAISGDLAKSLSGTSPEQETVTLSVVSGKTVAEESPVLVLGDSHTLFLSSGKDMLAENAGFCEQLAYKLKMPVDRIGVKGSAATAVRISLFRKAAKNPVWLKNKKYVIYVFSCREFTEAASGWMKVPVLK